MWLGSLVIVELVIERSRVRVSATCAVMYGSG